MKRKLASMDRMASRSKERIGENASEEEMKKIRTLADDLDEPVLEKRRQREAALRAIVPYTNKQRTLVFCSRGVSTRYRHLMEDLRALLPHHRREVKHDTKKQLHEINEVCELKSCNNCVFFEVRKKKDLFLWVTKAPNGPSAKFHVVNVHTMDELRLTGNALKGSRPILSFSPEFDDPSKPHLGVMKELYSQAFGTPRGHPKSKPFVDHVFHFAYLDGKIWFRNYQIVDVIKDKKEVARALKDGKEPVSLVEIGPRFVMNPVRIFDASFGGKTLYANPRFVSPNQLRSEESKRRGERYKSRKDAEAKRVVREKTNVAPSDPLDGLFK